MSPVINKFLVALATTIACIAVVSADGVMSQQDWLLVALDALGAIGVYAVPNAAKRPV